MTNRIAILLATWFGAGFSPVAPGTAGSLAAIVIAIVIPHARPWHFAALGAVFLAPAIWSADVTARVRKIKDPGIVVIDEVVGQWTALAGAATVDWKSCLAAFLLFRTFDIWKPPPVRQLEALPGGAGIVADDVMAGLYAAFLLWLAGWLRLF